MKRRRFLKAASAGAAASASAFSILKFPRGAHAAGWGAWPSSDAAKADALLPAELRAQSVLELHVNGGMSAWDTFYTIPEWGLNVGAGDPLRYMWLFSDDSQLADYDGSSLEERFEACRPAGVSNDLSIPFNAYDEAGNAIYLGPWAYPFRNRPDVLSRMRIVVQQHSNVAHEAANPISFTGTALGQPRMAGVGTAIQRYFSENPDAPGGGGVRAAPYAYVLYPGGYKPFNAVAATTVGFHPGSSRPLVVSVEPNSQLAQLLTRSTVDDTDAFDRAIAYYRASYEARMRPFGVGAPTRSAERANFEFASFARTNAPELTDILAAELFSDIPSPATICQQASGVALDMPAMQARMAASLITRADNAARYVMWIDGGFEEAPTGGHDVHNNSIDINGRNIPHTFQALLDIIATPEQVANGTTEGLINLDETMVVINTEFGRTPDRQGIRGGGTNHHPWGYVNVFIGGPVQEPSVYGYITEDAGYAQSYVTPAENRMMILQAMGIYPFSSQSFAVADVRNVEDEAEGALRIRDQLLLGV